MNDKGTRLRPWPDRPRPTATFDLSSDIVTIIVGEEINETAVRQFKVHSDLLKRNSDFFKAALAKEWKEGQERRVRLPNEQADVFAAFVQFMYSGRFDTGYAFNTSEEDLEHTQQFMTGCERAASCWTMGDRLLAIPVQDASMDVLCDILTHTDLKFSRRLVMDIYAETRRDSTLRKLCVDVAVYGWSPESFQHKQPQANIHWQEFLAEVAIRTTSDDWDPETEEPYVEDNCLYHLHAPGKENCYSPVESLYSAL